MLTFKDRIEDRIGSVGDDDALGSWLTSGAKFIINLLPEARLEKFTESLTDGGSGVEIKDYRVLSANKSGYGAIRVPQNLIARISDADSIYAATAEYPGWYILNGLAYVKPSGGTVLAMGYPEIFAGTDTIPSFPRDIDDSIVLFACIHGRVRQMTTLTITTLGGLSISTITKPTAPSAPAFIYIPAVYTDAAYTIADYVPALYANAEYTSAAYSAASAIDAAISNIGATTISFTDTLAYNPPVFTGSYTGTDTALTNQDIELASAHLSKTNVQLEEMQKDLANSLAEFNRDKGEFDANLQVAISQAQLTQQKVIQEANNIIELNKFNEQQTLQAALVNAQKTAEIDLSNKQAELQLSLANTGKALEVALANAVQTSQLDLANKKTALELDITNKSKALETAIINNTKDLERQIQEYASELQLYGQQMNGYSAEVNEQTSRVSIQLNQYNAQFQQYVAGLQVLQQEFQNYIKAL